MNSNERNPSEEGSVEHFRQYAQLTNDENAEFFKLLWAGDQSARDSLIAGNMHWVLRAAQIMSDQSDIPVSDFVAAGKVGLTQAVDKFSKLEFAFAPDETLKNGYAIWWVRMQFARLAENRRYEFNLALNTVFNSRTDV
jgi:DNA-directed RNA polymerase sigma subunit (sigma70/sigma32)